MEQILVEELFKERIDAIWKDKKYESAELRDRGYAIPKKVLCDAIMFIGSNPSLRKNDFSQGESSFYTRKSEESAEKDFPYFNKFVEVSEKVNFPWTHLDLLYVRETGQKLIKAYCSKVNEPFFDFAKQQCLMSKEIIERAKPRIIVVSNAYARDLMFNGNTENGAFKCSFDENIGTLRIENHPTLSGTPVFFTSMLTGQRALDLGSYDRLIWHIKFVLSKM